MIVIFVRFVMNLAPLSKRKVEFHFHIFLVFILLLCLSWFIQSWVMRFLNGNLVVLSDLMAVLVFLIRNETFLFIFLYVRIKPYLV